MIFELVLVLEESFFFQLKILFPMISCIHLEVTVTKCMLLFNLNLFHFFHKFAAFTHRFTVLMLV